MKTLLFGMVLAAGVGCMNIQPVGPLAKSMGGGSGPKAKAPPPDPNEPIMVAAPKPVPPASMVSPGDVNAENPNAAAQRLMSEFEADRKTMNATKTAEVSRIKDGVKVQ